METTTGRPNFLGNPYVPTPCSQTPARPTRPGHTAGRHGSTRIVRRGLSTRGNFGAQSHGISTSCLRFAVRLTPPHARLASGCLPGSTRRDWLPAGFLRKVSVMLLTSLSPFPSFLAQTISPFPPAARAEKAGTRNPWERQRAEASRRAYPYPPARRRLFIHGDRFCLFSNRCCYDNSRSYINAKNTPRKQQLDI